MSGSVPTLYGFKLSPPVRAVLLTLKALDLEFEFKEVNTLAGEHLSPEFVKKNPQHTVPTLEDDGHFIWDSHAIDAYLVRKYGSNDDLYPKDFYQRAVVDQRLHYENGVMTMTVLKNTVGPLFRGEMTKELFEGKIKEVHEVYAMLETFLADTPYIAGDNLTIADFSTISTVSTLNCIVPINTDEYPKLFAWLERMQALPYYDEANGDAIKQVNAVLQEKMAQL